MKGIVLTLCLIFISSIIGCAPKEEPVKPISPPQIPITQPEIYVPEQYEYKSFRQRDPFVPLVTAERRDVPQQQIDTKDPSQIDITNLELSGIIWDKRESMAVFRDQRGFGYILSKGRLLGDNFEPIKGIRGRIVENRRVFLYQGDTEVNFLLGKPKTVKIERIGVLVPPQEEEPEKAKIEKES